MKILVFTYHDDNVHEGASYREVGELTLPSKRAYCQRHGYDFLCRDDFDPAKTPLGYERIEMFLDHIDSYDYLWYIEADAMVMNPDIRLEDLIDPAYDLTITHDVTCAKHISVNNGSMLFKSSEWSKAFLNHINIPYYHRHPWVSQQAIIDALNHEPETLKHIRLVPWRFFNSVWHHDYAEHNWQPGDFVLHAAGFGNGWRKRLFAELAPKVASGKPFTIETPPC